MQWQHVIFEAIQPASSFVGQYTGARRGAEPREVNPRRHSMAAKERLPLFLLFTIQYFV